MKKSYPIAVVSNPLEALRKAGYSYFRDPQSGEESFVIRLTPEFYPRFHLYVEESPDRKEVTLNLHLDQKKPSYGTEKKHSGEYTGAVVEKEMSRIDSWIRAAVRRDQRDTSEHDIDVQSRQQQKEQGRTLKRLWKKLFG